ncbi:MAG: 30S ribosomal protein S1 [Holosporaceae bacterium]|jgi:small subunit ribosomal protein S1|nr:30S ribosomal protein S1 [Holosporaceae bacterium]
MLEELSAHGGGFAELFEQTYKKASWQGKVVKGVVLSVDDNFVTIDIGLKSEGRIATGEFVHGNRKIELTVGDKIDVYIDRYENKSGEVVLSREKALKEAAWNDFEKSFKEGANVMGTIYGRVKGGFMVDLKGATAFLPGSQVDVRPVKDIGPLMGIEQPFLILKMDKLRENIVVSRRGILEGSKAEEREKVMSGLEEGQVIDGIVKNITSYGAFIDIGGMDGLLHNVDIAWKRINHPSEVLTQGDTVSVKIIKFNRETKRVSLGMKQLTLDPWSGVDEEFKVGSRIKGKVTNVTDYGVFVEIKEGVEGLVYVSEVSWKKNATPSKVVATGEEIEVIVLDVDIAKRRIGLGMKQLQVNPWENIKTDFPIGHVFEGTVTNVVDFGIFVKVNSDIDGMVHVNDISWEKVGEADLAKYKKGDVIKVKILEIDQEKERVSLGIKQLTENPNHSVEIDVKKGAVVTCVVSAIKEDGIDVTLSSGSSGFIKKIELAKDRQDRRTDRFAVGEKVDAKVISIDKTGKKISLSIRSLEIEEEQQVMKEFGSSDSGASLGDILGIAINKKEKE